MMSEVLVLLLILLFFIAALATGFTFMLHDEGSSATHPMATVTTALIQLFSPPGEIVQPVKMPVYTSFAILAVVLWTIFIGIIVI